MRIAVIALLALAACRDKKPEPLPAPAPAPAAPKDAAQVKPLPVDAAVAAAKSTVCCCESTGDATHDTIEGDPSTCTADDMRGDCVELKSCGLDAPPPVLAVGTAVTVDSSGLVAIWKTKEEKAYGAVQIKPDGAHATVSANSSNDEMFKKLGKISAAPGPLTVTAQADGTALVSNGKTTWVLEQTCRYCPITFAKQKH